MQARYEQILDECIDLILTQGETVEACVGRYPEFKAELRPELELVASSIAAYDVRTSADAKARGRQRLAGERRALARQPAAGPGLGQVIAERIRRLPAPAAPRWAAAAGAVALVLILTGASLVIAARSAIPGDALYSVKLASEDIRLALTIGDDSRTGYRVELAERRARELAELLEVGRTDQLESTQGRLVQRINEAASADATAPSGEGSRIEDSAITALAVLQQAYHSTTPETRVFAEEVLNAAGNAYSDAIEQTANFSGEAVVSGEFGSMQIRAADPPPPDVEEVIVEVDDIEVHLAAGGNSRWISILDEPQTFDLLRVAEVQQLLAERDVPEGTYTRVRFSVVRTTVTTAGEVHDASVPSGRLSFARPMVVEAGTTTVLVLDFDGQRSLNVTGQGRYMLTPVVRTFAHAPGEIPPAATRVAAVVVPSPSTDRLPPTAAAALPLEEPLRLDVKGVITLVEEGLIVVNGRQIAVDRQTQRRGLAAGDRVEVEAAEAADGSLLALEIEVVGTAPTEIKLEIRGEVTSRQGNVWVVDSDRIRVTGRTEVEGGRITIGSIVNVVGVRGSDGLVDATRIRIEIVDSRPATPVVEPTIGEGEEILIAGVITGFGDGAVVVGGTTFSISSDTEIDGTLAVAAAVELEAVRDRDGVLIATRIRVENRRTPEPAATRAPERTPTPTRVVEPTDAPPNVTITGTIQLLGTSSLTVDGLRVILTGQTVVEGVPGIGLAVDVTGVLTRGGTIVADRVRVGSVPAATALPASPTPAVTSATPRPPTATPQPTATAAPAPVPAPTPTVTATQPPQTVAPTTPAGTMLTGVIESVGAGGIVVNGATVRISPSTRVTGMIGVGARVRVTGDLADDGSIDATQVTVLGVAVP